METSMPSSEVASPIDVLGISHAYGDETVLDDIHLRVEPGELLTLLGPSGSGKSTLLRLISGLLEVQSGEIKIAGKDVTQLPANRRDIGLVFQNYALFPHLSVEDNVIFPLRMRRIDKDERVERASQMLGLVGLQQTRRRMPSELSGGQQQRVAIARAVVAEPRVLLLDEPMGALDRRLRESLSLELRDLQRELGITTVYVTHDQEEAFALSDRIAVMNDGAIAQLDVPVTIYEAPTDSFTAKFLGDINAFRCRAETVGWDLQEFRTDQGLVIRSSGHEVTAGERLFVGIRPEGLRVSPGDGDQEPCFTGVVENKIFQGRGYRLQVRVGTDCLLIADTPRDDPSVVGQQVRLAYQPTSVIVCPDEAGRSIGVSAAALV
jgi:ABC-type Fe3+/spermidine/putrescine transport system ATPase subunit